MSQCVIMLFATCFALAFAAEPTRPTFVVIYAVDVVRVVLACGLYPLWPRGLGQVDVRDDVESTRDH